MLKKWLFILWSVFPLLLSAQVTLDCPLLLDLKEWSSERERSFPSNFALGNHLFFTALERDVFTNSRPFLIDIDLETLEVKRLKHVYGIRGIYAGSLYLSDVDTPGYMLYDPLTHESQPVPLINGKRAGTFVYYQNGLAYQTSATFWEGVIDRSTSEYNFLAGTRKDITELYNSTGPLITFSDDRQHLLDWNSGMSIISEFPGFKNKRTLKKRLSTPDRFSGGFLTTTLFYVAAFDGDFRVYTPHVYDLNMNLIGSFHLDAGGREYVMIFFSLDLTKALIITIRGNKVALIDTTSFRNWLDQKGFLFHPHNATITSPKAEIRQNANLQAKIYGRPQKDSQVRVIDRSGIQETIGGKSDYWYKIENPNGKAGWVFGGYLQLGEELTASGEVAPKPAPPQPKAVNIYASSFLTEPFDKNMYQPVKAFDGKPDTGWIEKVPGPGLGEYVGIELDKPITIDRITLMPGWFDARYWKQNNRIKRITIQLDDFETTVDLKDKMVPQEVRFKQPITFKRAKFTIRAVYPTSKWDDTALAEVEFYYKDHKIPLDLSKFADQLKVVPEEE